MHSSSSSAGTPSYLEGRSIVLSPESPLVAWTKAAEDEQIVNTALLLFLNCLTMFHPQVRLHAMEWTMARKVFQFEAWQARTDGFLRGSSSGTKAILEVKPFPRQKNIAAIQMQESAQVAAWIYQEPDTAAERMAVKDGKFR